MAVADGQDAANSKPEQLKSAVRQIIDVIKKPFMAIKEAIKKLVKTVKEIVKKIKEILLTIKRIIMAIVKVIKAAFEFLAKIINFCNKELGTPFERCTRVFENAIIDCNAKLGPLFNWLCSITYIVKSVCYLVKFLDFICMLVDFISDSIIGVVIRKVKTFIRHIRTMFYVRIKFSHSFQFQTQSSKSMAEVAHGIVAEIKDRTRILMALYDFMTSAATLFFMFIIFKVMYYRFKFLTSEKFDNIYITKDFRNLDMRRAKLGRETVLPLNNREMDIYIPANSKRLAKSEKKALSKAATTLATASLKLSIIIVTDYCLFWILNLIKYYGRFQSKVQAPNVPTAMISGAGLLADLLRSIVKAFQPVGIQLEIDTVPCLPTPIPPDYDCYIQIAIVIFLCWILTLLGPYGLRLRHTVMCYYHPMRAKERAIWLYNHIMRSRNSFLKFARRQLRRKIKGGEGIEKITCKEYLSANFKICRLCLGEGVQTACLLCGKVFRESDDKKPIRCSTPGCPGVYCEQCFSDLQNLCTVCLSPIQYGDLSDISEEKDSSEEEPRQWKAEDKRKKKRRWWCCKCCRGGEEEEDNKTKKRSLPSFKEYDSEDGETTAKLLGDTSSADEQDEAGVDRSGEQDRGGKLKDSDYYSSDSATDYSYSYQYDKNQAETQPKTTSVPFKDVEKQEIPDYATMESFREGIEDGTYVITPSKDIEAEELPIYETMEDITEETQIMEREEGTPITIEDIEDQTDEDELEDEEEIVTVQKSAGTIISGTTLEQNKRGRHIDFIGVPSKSKVSLRRKPKRRKKEKEEEIPLLGPGICICSDTDDMPITALLKSTTSTTTHNLPSHHSTSTEGDEQPGSVTSVPNSEVNDNLRNVQTEVPNLDFSGLTQQISKRSYVEDKFSDVVYEEISESPRSTPSGRNLTSSTNISSLNGSVESPVNSAEICECETELSVEREPSIDERTKLLPASSPSSADSYNLESNQRQRVKQYYKAVPREVPSKKIEEQQNPNRFIKFIQKIFPKRKKNLDDLPLYSTGKEIIELKSYNYSRGHWDTLSSSSSPDIDQSNSETPERPNSSDEEEEGERIRGGESGLVKSTNRILRRNRLAERTKRNTFDYTPLKAIPNSNVKPYESVTEDLLSRYFVSVEDLTPTRDRGTPMTTVEALKPTYGTSELLTEEVPEKEQNLLSPVASLAGEVYATSSSNLSADLINSILGSTFYSFKNTSSVQTSPKSTFYSFKNTSSVQTSPKTNSVYFDAIGSPQSFPELNQTDKNTYSVQINPENQDVYLETVSSLIELNKSDKIFDTVQTNPRSQSKYLETISSRQSPSKESQAKKISESQSELAVLIRNGSKPKRSKSKSVDNTVNLNINNLEQSNNNTGNLNNLKNSNINNTRKSNLSNTVNNTENFIKSGISITQRSNTDNQGTPVSSKSVSLRSSRKEFSNGTGNNQISAKTFAAPRGSKVDERSEQTSHSSQQNKDLNKKSCKCKTPPQKDQELQTTFPRPIIKTTPRSENSLITIKSASATSQTTQSFTEPENMEAKMLSMADRDGGTDKRVDTGEKYPVKGSSHDVASKHSQKVLLTSNKMQQTSNEGIHQLEIPAKPTTSTNRATAGSHTNSTNARSSSTNRHSTCIETTETIEPTSSSNLCCDCRCAKLDAANNKFSYKCCKCAPPPPPPRHEEYVSLQDKCCRDTSPPEAYPKCVTYAERHHRCCRDVPSELSIRSGRRKVYRDFPENDDYPCCEKQYTEFRRTPCDECASEASRRTRQLEPDRQRRRQSPGNRMISPCNGDCRCCAKNRKSRQPPTPSCRYRPIEHRSSSSDISDDVEDDDDVNYFSDGPPNRFDLPYQDNDEYLELVQELEETLQSRNRNRVRRAMQEFEHRSRYNKPLDQPIINYDETSESEEPIIEKLSKITSGRCYRCCEGEMCTCRRRNLQPFGKRGQNKTKEQRPRSRGYPCATRCRQKHREGSAKTHWQLDKSSGEWYKVPENPQRRRSQRRSRTPSPQRDYCPYNCNCCGARGYDYR